MALLIVICLFSAAFILALLKPGRALTLAVFFAPWAGLDVDVGLRVTAYLIVITSLACVFALSCIRSNRAMDSLRFAGLLWFVIAYAILWSFSQLLFLPEVIVRGGALRSPEFRAMTQILMFLITISPIFIVPWLLRGTAHVHHLFNTYLVSLLVLAGFGWIQILVLIITGNDPMPVGFIDNLLGGQVDQRSGQFTFNGDVIFRMSSFGGEPKMLGASLVVGLLLVQAGFRPNVRWGAALWPFLFLSMILTFSTMAMLVWIAASLVQLVLWRRAATTLGGSKLVVNRNYLFLGVIVLIFIPVIFIAFPESRIVQLIEMRTIDRVADMSVMGSGPGFVEDFNKAIIGFLSDSPIYALTGVGLGNAHLYADSYLPDYAVIYAGGTTFVAKSYLLRWVSELGIISLIVFLFWWVRMIGYSSRTVFSQSEAVNIASGIQRVGWAMLLFWLVSGYVTPQFFLLTGIVVGLNSFVRLSCAGNRLASKDAFVGA